MAANLQAILARFPSQRVLIAGDVMLDEYVWGEVRRISPEAPVPVVEIRRQSVLPGGAANTAMNVSRLGGRALLVGVVGGDSAAHALRDQLEQSGVDLQGLAEDATRLTTTKTRIIAHNQQIVRVDREQRLALSPQLEQQILKGAHDVLAGVGVCILSDYGKGMISARFAEQFIDLARRAGKAVLVDPKGADYTKYRGATIIKPNVHEAERFIQRDLTSEADLAECGRHMVEALDLGAVLLTRGAAGMSLFRPGVPAVHIPSVAKDVFDVTGAGDTVAGTVAMAVAAGASLEEAAHLANRAAGIVVGKVGTCPVTLTELQTALNYGQVGRLS
jgi:D-beta-D-heptose 7-phosphate kinase/D-beta-D-heptose 1-phosphate adenosyltransferase